MFTMRELLATVTEETALEVAIGNCDDTIIYADVWEYCETRPEDLDRRVYCIEPVVLYIDEVSTRGLYVALEK